MLSELVSALAQPSPRTRAAVGGDVLDKFLAMPSGDQLRVLERDLARLNEEEIAEFVPTIAAELAQPFVPIPGPQERAFNSAADELLFGGAAGGGKSRVLLGIAATGHSRSLILRRQLTETDGLADELVTMLGRAGYNKNDREHISFRRDGVERSIKLGGINGPDDWQSYAGRARDGFFFDEAGEFLEVQVVSLLSWLRSTDPNQRCRVVFASNPPRGVEGQWLIEWFAPWIEPTFERPAKDGELRWFIFPRSQTQWVEGPGEYEVDGETYTAKSRTFIRARLADNPFLSRDNVYLAQLQNRPEPLRSQLLHGDFLAGREDDAWQVIPSDWIQQARMRWTPSRPDMPMTTLGIDVAQGGGDRTTLAGRYGSWFGPVKAVPGDQTPDGLSVATLAFGAMRDGCTVVVDLGGGWGGDAYGHLARHLPEEALVGFMGINPSHALSLNGIERFANLRAMAWWRFREALDPATGADIALPPDPELAAELAMPRRVPERREILIESKEQIIKRLGRSPDCLVAGTVVMTPRGDIAIENLREGDEVVTPYGNRTIIRVHSRHCDNVVDVLYRGRVVLSGKPTHRVFTWEDGWVRLSDVRAFHTLEPGGAWKLLKWRLLNLLLTAGRNTGFKDQVDIISQSGATMARRDFFIAGSGRMLMGQSPRASISTTLTETGQTIASLIWRRLTALNTTSPTWLRVCWMRATARNCGSGLHKVRPRQRSGIDLTRAVNGIANMVGTLGSVALPLPRFAWAAAGPTRPGWRRHFGVHAPVGRESTHLPLERFPESVLNAAPTSLRTNTGPTRNAVPSLVPTGSEVKGATVYDITLDRDNVYYANGYLVENCADAVVMAWCYGTERALDRQMPQRLQTQQNVGYDSAKRRRRYA